MKIQYRDQHLTIFESALFRTTSSVVQTDDFILVVDPNWLPHEVEAIHFFVEKNKKDKPVFLLFTHSNYDHIIGYRAFENAKVIASTAFQNNSTKATIISQIRKFDDENYISRSYPIVYPQVDFPITEDGEKLVLGNTELIFFQAKGHNRDGIFTLIPSLGIWLAGDYLSNIEFPYMYHSSKEYLETLEKAMNILDEQNINILVTGHGDYSTDKTEIQYRINESKKYIEDLQQCIKTEKEFEIESLWKKYDFPIIMKQFHEKNIELIKKEMNT